MRTGLLYVSLLSVTFGLAAQSPSSPEETIQRALNSGVIEGHLIKTTGSMGDAAAIAITKVVGEKPLRPDEVETILDILSGSFADPRLIANGPDREPRTTLFVLRYLAESTNDQSLKHHIGEVRQNVLNRYNQYKMSQ